jgi:putative transposase
MVGFINGHRAQYGVEPICAALPIAPSTYFRHQRRHVDPTCRSARARRDDEWRVAIQRVWHAHFQVYGRGRSGDNFDAKVTAWHAVPYGA